MAIFWNRLRHARWFRSGPICRQFPGFLLILLRCYLLPGFFLTLSEPISVTFTFFRCGTFKIANQNFVCFWPIFVLEVGIYVQSIIRLFQCIGIACTRTLLLLFNIVRSSVQVAVWPISQLFAGGATDPTMVALLVAMVPPWWQTPFLSRTQGRPGWQLASDAWDKDVPIFSKDLYALIFRNLKS